MAMIPSKIVANGAFQTLAVVGAGNMGSGIAQKMASEGFDVILVDLDDDKVQRGLRGIEKTLNDGIERKLFTADQVAAILSRIRGTTRFEDLKDADLVVEAVFEDIGVKRDVFARLERRLPPDCILADQYVVVCRLRYRGRHHVAGSRHRPALLLPSGEEPSRRSRRRPRQQRRGAAARLVAAGAHRQDADPLAGRLRLHRQSLFRTVAR